MKKLLARTLLAAGLTIVGTYAYASECSIKGIYACTDKELCDEATSVQSFFKNRVINNLFTEEIKMRGSTCGKLDELVEQIREADPSTQAENSAIKVEKNFPLGNVDNLRKMNCSQDWKVVEGEALEKAALRIANNFKGCTYSAYVHWQDMQPNFDASKYQKFSRNLYVRIGLNNLRIAPGTRSGLAGWKLKQGLLNDRNHFYKDTDVSFTVGTVKEVRILGKSLATGQCDVNVRFRLWFSELIKIGNLMMEELGQDNMTFSNCYRVGLSEFKWVFNSIDEF